FRRCKTAQNIIVHFGQELKAAGQKLPPERMTVPPGKAEQQRIPNWKLCRVALSDERLTDLLVLNDVDGAPVGQLGNGNVSQRRRHFVVIERAGQQAELVEQAQSVLRKLTAVNVSHNDCDA